MTIKGKIAKKPVVVEADYKPLPKQLAFHESPAKYRLYVGGFGSGKTFCGCHEALFLCMEYPGILGVVCRATYPELRDTTRREFFGVLDSIHMKEGRDYTFNRSENHLKFANGSEVLFRSLDDVDKFKSLNLGFFYIDEASETHEDIFLVLKGRLRQKGVRRCGIMTSNPEGHDWLWTNFVATDKPGYELFHAPTTENIHLPADYVAELMRYPENWRKRYVEGSFDVFEGQVYPMFDRDIHVIDPFPIPKEWERGLCLDHGYRNPTAVVFLAADYDGNLYAYNEHYEAGQLVSYHAGRIKGIWGDEHCSPIIDPACKAGNGINGKSVIDEYRDHEIYCRPGNNDVIAGINRVSEYLQLDEITGKPRLFIFRGCENLITELQQYKWEKLKPGTDANEPERPVKTHDHAVDALRYFIMSRPQVPVVPKEETPLIRSHKDKIAKQLQPGRRRAVF